MKGRPTISPAGKRVKMVVKLDPELKAWLDAKPHGTRGQLVNDALEMLRSAETALAQAAAKAGAESRE